MRTRMRNFGYGNKKLHALFFNIMEGGSDPHGQETINQIMREIQDFLDACYMLGIIPLPELGRILPQYLWTYHKLRNRNSSKQIIKKSDFIWRVNWLEDWHGHQSKKIELVTAVHKNPNKDFDNRHPERFLKFWAENKDRSGGSDLKLQLKFIKSFGGNAIHD